jgi:hypothetical protein
MGQHCPTKFSDDFPSVQTYKALHWAAEARFLLDLRMNQFETLPDFLPTS